MSPTPIIQSDVLSQQCIDRGSGINLSRPSLKMLSLGTDANSSLPSKREKKNMTVDVKIDVKPFFLTI